MSNFKFVPTQIPDVIVIQPHIFGDARGFFLETYQEEVFKAAGISLPFVQDNHSGSSQGTLRGLHYQIQQPQGKLVRPVAGVIFDVAVDLRRRSPTFGQWVSARLSAEEHSMLWVPPGFAHGFYVISEWAEIVYKATDFYAPDAERSLLWSDPQLSIPWPLVDGKPPLLSGKDAVGQPLAEAEFYA
ncbi:MAG: dTDP-4-dehydrorhamnose 3,5-epimerase [Anaerolineaceae bacterium]|nr:dTDP-4-dehydrorhamnose 3,5-epimerase [Anaerolineaceae bacterium]